MRVDRSRAHRFARCRLWLSGLLALSFVSSGVGRAEASTSPPNPSPAVVLAQPAPSLASPKVVRPAPVVPAARGYSTGLPSPAPTRVSEIVTERTATSSTWKNSDGSRTVRSFASPQFYRPRPSADWEPIDTALTAVAGEPGRWRSGANSWQVSFGPADGAGGLQQITVAGARIGFTPLGVAQPGLAPSVSGSTATYPGLWPNVDLVERVTADAVIEDLVLTGPGAAASYTFRLSGARCAPA